MKKFVVSAAAIAILTGFSSFVVTAWGQAGNSPSKNVPHKIGLIDMAHIFKEYDKFKELRIELKADISQSDAKARQMAQQLKALQAELKMLVEGTDQHSQVERRLVKGASEFEAFRKVAQRDFLRKESQIYKMIYLEVSKTAKMYAKHYDFTLIMRFTREGLETTAEPRKVIEGMNRQVVFFRPADDITDPVLKYLNQEYGNSAGTAQGTRPGGTRRQ